MYFPMLPDNKEAPAVSLSVCCDIMLIVHLVWTSYPFPFPLLSAPTHPHRDPYKTFTTLALHQQPALPSPQQVMRMPDHVTSASCP